MKQMTVDRSLKKLSIEILTMKIVRAESPLASFFVCIKFLWRNFRWAWLSKGLATIALQAPLDRARRELPGTF